MQCPEFERRMQRLLDARQRPEDDPRLLAHADDCPPCAELLSAQEQLFEALEYVRVPRVSRRFAERVVLASTRQQKLRSVTTLLAAAALAASLLLILLPALRSGRQPELTYQSPERMAAALDAEPSAMTTDGVEIDPEQYRALLQGLLLQMHRWPQLQQVDHIVGRFRPLASTLNVAIDMLWRSTFPEGQDYRSEESAGFEA